MSAWIWVISVSVAAFAVACIILAIYLIFTLIEVRRTLENVNDKVHDLDPLFRIAEGLGKSLEDKVNPEKKEVEVKRAVQMGYEVAEWAILGLTLFQKIKERRR